MEICYKEIQISDFKPGTLLYLIAKENIQLASMITQQFGGAKEYIQIGYIQFSGDEVGEEEGTSLAKNLSST